MSGARLVLRVLRRDDAYRFESACAVCAELELTESCTEPSCELRQLRNAVADRLVAGSEQHDRYKLPADGPLLLRQEKLHDIMEWVFVDLLSGDELHRLELSRRYLGRHEGKSFDPEGLGAYFPVSKVNSGDTTDPGRSAGFVLGLEVIE